MLVGDIEMHAGGKMIICVEEALAINGKRLGPQSCRRLWECRVASCCSTMPSHQLVPERSVSGITKTECIDIQCRRVATPRASCKNLSQSLLQP